MNEKSNTARALPVPVSRIARLGQLSSLTAGVAGNMALHGISQLGQGQRPSMRNLLLTPQNINRVADQLAKMRGAAMKIGQLMSMDTGDVLPPELARIMARLRDDAHFMPPSQLKQVLNANWPTGWLGQFHKFDVQPIAAASIGQVHRAKLKDGRELAIKVQYPGVAKSIDSDVANVGALMRMSGLLPKGFELAPYLEEAKKQLHEETDYTREGEQLSRFGDLLDKSNEFSVPALHRDWTTRDVLAMTYLRGTAIENAVQESQAVRDQIARQLIELTLRELFSFRFMQTDPNFANYLYDPETQRIILLDFGAARSLDDSVVKQYRELVRAGLAGNRARLSQVAKEIGFVGSQTKLAHLDQVVQMIAYTFNVLTKTPKYNFAEKELSNQMNAYGIALAEDGFVPPPVPIDILLIQRKLGGVFLLAAKLGAQVAVADLLERYSA